MENKTQCIFCSILSIIICIASMACLYAEIGNSSFFVGILLGALLLFITSAIKYYKF